MKLLRSHGDAQDEAQRHSAEMAARPGLTDAERATCLYHAMCAAKQAGDIAKARALAGALQPLLSALPEAR